MGIEVRNVTFSYGKREILHGISIDVKKGSFVGLIGPNGSGKTTLLKLIYRYLKPDGGSICLDGKSIADMNYKESARMIAVVTQSNLVQFNFSVKEMVLLGRSPYKRRLERMNQEDYRIVRETLEMFQLSAYAERNMNELSGGEQQRVFFARAMAQKTPFLLMDEPTNQFDITYQLEMMRTVKQGNKTILASFHDLNIAALFCDYLYCIRDGEIIAEGTPEEILTEDRIREIYHVSCEVTHDSNGKVHILYHSDV